MNWIGIRCLLIVVETMKLDTKAIDSDLAFPQAEVDIPVYMDIQARMNIGGLGEQSVIYVLQADYNWHLASQVEDSTT